MLGVVTYHFNSEILPGGFVGVDIFFVISGYLMTKIIMKKLESSSFSYFEFMERRSKRIVPPLALMVLFFLAVNWSFAYTCYYEEQGKHGLESLIFISNITFWRESGYFEAVSSGKLFLHTWSLSVEWQFYLIYPIVLLLISKVMPLRYVKYVLLFGFMLSYLICIFGAYKYQSANFYLLPSRAWEMLLGALAFVFSFKFKDDATASFLGIILILLSMFFIDASIVWPSWYSMVPALGAFLVIWSDVDWRFYGYRIFQYLGLMSYSIYLWHWPFLAMKFNGFLDLNAYLIFFFVVILSSCSYFMVERKA